MTACIVGWAHSRFGKLEGETLESLIADVANRGAGACRHRPRRCRRDRARPLQRRLLRRRTSPRAWCCRPTTACASSRRRASRTPARPARQPCARASGPSMPAQPHRAGGRRRADDDDARAGDRQEPAERLLSARGGRHAGRFRRRLRQDRAGLFPAPWRPVGRAGDDRRQEPQERRRQSLCADAQGSRLRLLPRTRARRTPSSPAR